MRLNSPEMLKTGRELVRRFGSWSEVRRNSVQLPSGVFAVKPWRKPQVSQD